MSEHLFSPLAGVSCGVKNYRFNENNRCCAESIAVSPQWFDGIAVTGEETICQTFSPR